MRKRRNTREDIIIDLTSLLDVIFILLLIILCGQSVSNKDLVEKLASTERAEEQVETLGRLYNDMLETADSLNDYVRKASISVPYKRENVQEREIKVLVEGKEPESFSLVGNEDSESFEAFEKFLVDYIVEHKDYPVILSFNENDELILYRDENKVNEIIFRLSETYGNVYIKGIISEK